MKIILSAALAFFLLGCNDDATTQTAQKEISQQAHETATVVAKSTDDVLKKAKEATSVVSEQVQKVTQKSIDKVKKVSTEVVKKVSQTSHEVVQKSAKAVEKAAKEIQTSATPAKPALDGKKLFTACAGCHGSHAEKHALGKSHIIKGWAVKKIETALHGYQNGTYGGSMKGIMKGQASKLNDAKIEALAKYISKQ